MKKIILLYLGDFYYDARCINMSLSILKSNCFNLSVLSTSDINQDSIFNKIKFFKIQDLGSSPFKYWYYHKQIKKILHDNHFDIIICGDLYSLSGASCSKAEIIFDCREIYTELEAHSNKSLYKLFWKIYEKHYL